TRLVPYMCCPPFALSFGRVAPLLARILAGTHDTGRVPVQPPPPRWRDHASPTASARLVRILHSSVMRRMDADQRPESLPATRLFSTRSDSYRLIARAAQ